MAVPGSHKGPLDDHHHQGVFIGAVDPANSHYDLSTAEPFLAKAGSISLHHVRSLHGSKKIILRNPDEYYLLAIQQLTHGH